MRVWELNGFGARDLLYFGVGDVQEVLRLRAQLDVLALEQLGVLELHDVALGQQQVLHHPIRQVHLQGSREGA